VEDRQVAFLLSSGEKTMKLVRWDCPNAFSMPMVEDDDLDLWGVTKGAAGAFAVQEQMIDKLFQTYPDELGTKATSSSVREFFRQNRAAFGIQRVRRILSEDDVLLVAMHLHTPESRVARHEFLKFIKLNMRKNFVTLAEYQQLLGRVEAIESGVPYVQRAASAAGAALAAHRGTSRLQLVK
jgi:hypothetical protein